MANSRSSQKMVWTDIEFERKLRKIRAKRELSGRPVRNNAQLTKEMLECPSFNQLEKELLDIGVKNRLKVKMDSKRLF